MLPVSTTRTPVVTVTGEGSRYLGPGMRASIRGTWAYHATYGQQVVADIIDMAFPCEEANLKQYLASGAIPGIGTVLAHRLLNRFGVDMFRIAEKQPERLSRCKGNDRERD